MQTLELTIALTYDAELMHGDDAEATAWFFEEILQAQDGLLLSSAALGDVIGTVRVLQIGGHHG